MSEGGGVVKIRIVRAAIAALALGALSGPVNAGEPLKIRHVYTGLPNTLSPLVFQNPAIMKHLGKSYTIEPVHFAGTSPEVTALAANELDIATLGFSSFAAAVQNAHLDDLRIIADGFQDGVGDYLSTTYFVRAGDPIKKIEDLKGKVLATNAIGGSVDVAMKVMLRKHGLEDRRDYTVVEAQFPSMPALLREKKADLIGSSPPFIYDPSVTKDMRGLFTMKDAVGQT